MRYQISGKNYQHALIDEEAAWQSEDQVFQVEQGSGCISGFLFPPMIVLIVMGAISYLGTNTDIQIEAVNLNASLVANASSFSGVGFDDQTNSSDVRSGNSSPLSPIFLPEVQFWGADISRWASQFNLDPNLVATVMQIESCGHPRAVSRSGAMGLFQVMPFHFFDSDEPYDPDTNAARGLAYLYRSLETAGGEIRLALAGYNGGVGVISRPESSWSDQTRRYVQYSNPIYIDATNGSTSSEALNLWYSNYGASLCRQARTQIGLD